MRRPALSLLLLFAATGGCATALPRSAGPYDAQGPGTGARTIEERGGALLLPAPGSAATSHLAVRARGDRRWTDLATAIQTSVTSEARIAFLVTDADGAQRWVSVPTRSRATEALWLNDTLGPSKDEHVLTMRPRAPDAFTIWHQGVELQPSQLATMLASVFARSGTLYFPQHEAPRRELFPVWLRPEPGLPLQSVVDVLGVVQSAGFPTVLIELR